MRGTAWDPSLCPECTWAIPLHANRAPLEDDKLTEAPIFSLLASSFFQHASEPDEGGDPHLDPLVPGGR